MLRRLRRLGGKKCGGQIAREGICLNPPPLPSRVVQPIPPATHRSMLDWQLRWEHSGITSNTMARSIEAATLPDPRICSRICFVWLCPPPLQRGLLSLTLLLYSIARGETFWHFKGKAEEGAGRLSSSNQGLALCLVQAMKQGPLCED